MNFDLRPYLAIWAVFALAVMVLLVRRKMVASKEDDNIHVMSNPNADQMVVAAKLDVIDKWGKILTAVTVVFGLVLVSLYIWAKFTGTSSLGE